MKLMHFSELVFEHAKKRAKHRIVFYRDDALSQWIGLTWQELADKVKETAIALLAAGVKELDRVGICSQNKPQCLMVDFANFANRAVSVPMYSTLSPSQMDYIINDAQIAILFVGEQQQYDNALEVLQDSAFLKKIIVFDQSVDLKGEQCAAYFSDFIVSQADYPDAEKIIKKRQKAATEDDLAGLLYTSGTTGEPKGVMLSHGNLLEAMRIHSDRVPISKREKSIAFLPLSHIFERAWTYYCLLNDVKVYLNHQPTEIQRTIREVRPHYMCAVPRFWEKVCIGVEEKIETYSPFKKGLVTWAIATGQTYNLEYKRVGKKPGVSLWLRYFVANSLVFNKLKKTLGIENSVVFPVAGAALSDKLAFFFRSLGIPIVYGYGLTETTATVSCYNTYDFQIGSVGELMPDVQVRIGDDNEILIKGKTITPGYYNKPEATAEAFIDGWFRTGDSGKMDGNHLYMTDRIKDLFKTSNGKYISPQQIETLLGNDKYIEQIAVIGNNRSYVTAIIAPSIPALKEFAQEKGITYDRLEDLLVHPQVTELIQERIEKQQEKLSSFEKIKKFRLIKQGFTIASGEMTSTLKLRRAVILQNYSALIEEMYQGTTPKF